MYLQEMLAGEEQAAADVARAAQPQLLIIHPLPARSTAWSCRCVPGWGRGALSCVFTPAVVGQES